MTGREIIKNSCDGRWALGDKPFEIHHSPIAILKPPNFTPFEPVCSSDYGKPSPCYNLALEKI